VPASASVLNPDVIVFLLFALWRFALRRPAVPVHAARYGARGRAVAE
jgi:hypothetical protein